MFDRIASRYDLLNRLLSLGRDVAWRRRLVRALGVARTMRVLDVAAGTGDVLLALADNSENNLQAVGWDLSAEMLKLGRAKIARRGLDDRLFLALGDAERFGFRDATFDAATVAFGIRNFSHLSTALQEIRRVLKPGGRFLALEFSLPANRVIRALYLTYFRHALPFLGGIISGDRQAYRYLNESVETFPHGRALCDLFCEAGFADVTAQPLTFGVATLYTARKGEL